MFKESSFYTYNYVADFKIITSNKGKSRNAFRFSESETSHVTGQWIQF